MNDNPWHELEAQQREGRPERIRTDEEIDGAMRRFCDEAWMGKAIFSIPVNLRDDADIILSDAWNELRDLRSKAAMLTTALRLLSDIAPRWEEKRNGDTICGGCGAKLVIVDKTNYTVHDADCPDAEAAAFLKRPEVVALSRLPF